MKSQQSMMDKLPSLGRVTSMRMDMAPEPSVPMSFAPTSTVNSFLLNFTILILISFGLGRWPQHASACFVVVMGGVMGSRLLRYPAQGMGYWLLEFCCIADFLMVGFLALVLFMPEVKCDSPSCREWFVGSFAVGSGVIMLANFAFKFAFKFDCPEMNASFLIHFMPALFFYCVRFGAGHGPRLTEQALPGKFVICATEAQQCMDSWSGVLWCDACPVHMLSLWKISSLLHLGMMFLPQLIYLNTRFITLQIAKKPDACALGTYDLLVGSADAPCRKALMGDTHPFASKIIFLSIHFVVCVVPSALLGYVFWRSFVASTLNLAINLSFCVWNGAKAFCESVRVKAE